ncbi:hypothetical protein PTKIN_Ptkin08bG0044900 [Pterospermum kingtungense]
MDPSQAATITLVISSQAAPFPGLGPSGRLPRMLSAFSFRRKFAVCLSSSPSSNGVVFFGDGPYVFLPNNLDISKSLIYTPLILNPVSTAVSYFVGEPSSDYFIGVKGITINGKAVRLNTTLLSMDKQGRGGTKISTVNPYTAMETSIYRAVVNAFVKEISQVPRVPVVALFGACFNAKSISSSRVGPAVPQIDLVLQNKHVIWSIFGSNSMVQVSNDVLCVGFVDGGLNPRTSIVIGGHQIENNLLQFDVVTSRLGFSSSLILRQTACADFNFTSNA